MTLSIDGHKVLIDDEDCDLVMKTSWFVHNRQNTPKPYFRTQRKMKALYLHRLVMGDPTGKEVDHINGDTLDNRKSNLRLATRSQNCMNATRYKSNTSGFKGVCLHKETGRWRARITVNKKRMALGNFLTPEEAYAAYCEAAKRYHGEFARLE